MPRLAVETRFREASAQATPRHVAGRWTGKQQQHQQRRHEVERDVKTTENTTEDCSSYSR